MKINNSVSFLFVNLIRFQNSNFVRKVLTKTTTTTTTMTMMMMMLNVPAIALAAMVILNISHDVALWVSGAKMAPGEATLSKNRDEQISNCKDSE